MGKIYAFLHILPAQAASALLAACKLQSLRGISNCHNCHPAQAAISLGPKVFAFALKFEQFKLF
jgi:hypothetical protein